MERGVEVVSSPFPVLITVHSSAAPCRARNAKKIMKYKHACTVSELQEMTEDYIQLHKNRPYLDIEEWTVEDLNADEQWLGLTGSPTKVKKIMNVVFTAKESKILTNTDNDIESLMVELIENHTIG